MAHDPLTQNLIEYWRHHYLRVTLASSKRTEEQIKEEEISSLSMYMNSVKQAFSGKSDDMYTIQYVPIDKKNEICQEELDCILQQSLWHSFNSSSSWKTWTDRNSFGNSHLSDPKATNAAFSVRYLGRPILDDESEVKDFEYASSLPVSISRLVGSKVASKASSTTNGKIIHNIVLGQESPLIENECYSTSTESPFGTFPSAWTK